MRINPTEIRKANVVPIPIGDDQRRFTQVVKEPGRTTPKRPSTQAITPIAATAKLKEDESAKMVVFSVMRLIGGLYRFEIYTGVLKHIDD